MTTAANPEKQTEEPSAGEPLADEMGVLVSALEQALADEDLSGFYRVFRASRLPFLCGECKDQADRLFPACFEILHRLGAVSPAVALAVENHLYVTSAIATFPTDGDPSLDQRREELLASIVEGRLLVANTNSRVHSSKVGEFGTVARRRDTGFRVNGMAAYTSLATEADLLVLLTEVEGEGLAVFAIQPMQENPSLEIGPYLFPSAMIDSDTRRITFHDLWLPQEAVIATVRNPVAKFLFTFEMAWHQLLIPALYLGAAARAIEEARLFLSGTKGPDGRPLAQLDGMITDVGRLALDYRSARCVIEKAGEALADVKRLPRDANLVDRAVQLASVAKYTATRAAESIMTSALRIIGARAFAGGCAIERLSREVVFASLGPEVSAVIERRHGKQVLNSTSFWTCFVEDGRTGHENHRENRG